MPQKSPVPQTHGRFDPVGARHQEFKVLNPSSDRVYNVHCRSASK